jgi:probable HAF family extracellular repeat protein
MTPAPLVHKFETSLIVTSKGYRAVRWDPGSTATKELDVLGHDARGVANSGAYVINASGSAAGYSNKYVFGVDKGRRAVRWDVSGAVTELGNLGVDANGFTNSFASSINDAGTTFGSADKYVAASNMGPRPVRWEASSTTAIELGNLGVDKNGTTLARIHDSNANGVAVGYANKYFAGLNVGYRAVRWDATSTEATELAFNNSLANAINDAGIVVGFADGRNGHSAALWWPSGAVINLNDLIDPASGWSRLFSAVDINNNNWITGVGIFDSDGAGPLDPYDRWFLMRIPEPSSFGALAWGACSLTTWRTRKRGLRQVGI